MTAKPLEEFRRVVTGYGPDGRSKVLFDGPPTQIARFAQIWTTTGSPVDNTGDEDAALLPIATDAPEAGSMVWVVRMAPGNKPSQHATRTLDYGVILEGEVTLCLDDEEVVLKQHDLVVQRGTSHRFENRTSEPALIMFVLLDSKEIKAP